MKTYIPENFRSRILLAIQTTEAAAQAYAAPTAGVNAITLRGVAKMGHAADLTLSLKYADDAAGTNATDFPVAVPVYVNGVRQSANAKSYAVTDSTGNFIVDFLVDPATIPEGKFVGLSYANSNAANLLATSIIEETAFSNTAS